MLRTGLQKLSLALPVDPHLHHRPSPRRSAGGGVLPAPGTQGQRHRGGHPPAGDPPRGASRPPTWTPVSRSPRAWPVAWPARRESSPPSSAPRARSSTGPQSPLPHPQATHRDERPTTRHLRRRGLHEARILGRRSSPDVVVRGRGDHRHRRGTDLPPPPHPGPPPPLPAPTHQAGTRQARLLAWPASATSPTGASSTAVYLAADAGAAAAARGRGGGGQDRGGEGAGGRHRRPPDPAAVPRGHRPPPRPLRLGLPAPAAAPARPGGERRGRSIRERFLLRRPLLEALQATSPVGAADRRDRPRRRRVRGLPARAALGLPGLDPGARHGHAPSGGRWW